MLLGRVTLYNRVYTDIRMRDLEDAICSNMNQVKDSLVLLLRREHFDPQR